MPDFFLLLDTSLLLLFVTAGIVLWWRVRASYGVLVLALLAPPALSGNPQSLTRYLAILFPAFILLALIESRPARYALSLVSLLGFAFLLRMFLRALGRLSARVTRRAPRATILQTGGEWFP